jgi:hypothetical protein
LECSLSADDFYLRKRLVVSNTGTKPAMIEGIEFPASSNEVESPTKVVVGGGSNPHVIRPDGTMDIENSSSARRDP